MRSSILNNFFYNTSFWILFLILLGLTIIPGADMLHQAFRKKQDAYIIIIGGAYLLFCIIFSLLFASRRVTHRNVIRSIPKSWVPVEKGDVKKNVREMIVQSLSRSAVVAWEARPRVAPPAFESRRNAVTQADIEDTEGPEDAEETEKPKDKAKRYQKIFGRKKKTAKRQNEGLSMPPHRPVWGIIGHEGWSSPYSPDLPNLQYNTVIQELPHLIEAKAVSLAPMNSSSSNLPHTPDLRLLDLLQRPISIGLRDYVSHLTDLGILSPSPIIAQFITSYENARFSSLALSEERFRELMRLFADILRGMNPISETIIQSIEQDESDIDGDMSSTTTAESPRAHSPASSRSVRIRSHSQNTARTAPSLRVPTEHSATRQSVFGTAPTTPSRKQRTIERSPSVQSFSQTRRPYPVSQASSGSLRSQSSVIRLSPSHSTAELPYTLIVPDGRPE